MQSVINKMKELGLDEEKCSIVPFSFVPEFQLKMFNSRLINKQYYRILWTSQCTMFFHHLLNPFILCFESERNPWGNPTVTCIFHLSLHSCTMAYFISYFFIQASPCTQKNVSQ